MEANEQSLAINLDGEGNIHRVRIGYQLVVTQDGEEFEKNKTTHITGEDLSESLEKKVKAVMAEAMKIAKAKKYAES